MSPAPPWDRTGSFCCRWQFRSEGADIGFGVYLKTKIGERQRAGEMTEVHPNQRYNSHMVPEDGSLTCPTPGICASIPLPWGARGTLRVLPESLTPPPPSPRRRPALRQHLQLPPRQEGELQRGGAAARRHLRPADPEAGGQAQRGDPQPQPLATAPHGPGCPPCRRGPHGRAGGCSVAPGWPGTPTPRRGSRDNGERGLSPRVDGPRRGLSGAEGAGAPGDAPPVPYMGPAPTRCCLGWGE